MERRVTIQWTDTAKAQLAQLPPKVRRGLLSKAGNLRRADDARSAGKPLVGPLLGYYRITYGRYRAIYEVKEEKIANGAVLVHVRICFLAAGKRKARDKKDIYNIAVKLVELGVLGDEQPADD